MKEIKEAVKYFKGMLFTADMSASTLKAIEMNELAIEALEKQIPKKVTLDRNCPTCGADAYANSYDDIKYNFCDNCGQRLDWGDDHDTQA